MLYDACKHRLNRLSDGSILIVIISFMGIWFISKVGELTEAEFKSLFVPLFCAYCGIFCVTFEIVEFFFKSFYLNAVKV